MQKITTFLTFNNQAEDAINFYLSVFPGSKAGSINRIGGGEPGTKGTVVSGNFELFGQNFVALNGGPHFSFSEGMSLFINCETQDEIDYYWSKLSEGGVEQPCGWLKDKFGVSWQVVPGVLGQLLGGSDPVKTQRVVTALLKMGKLDIKMLQDAYEGTGD